MRILCLANHITMIRIALRDRILIANLGTASPLGYTYPVHPRFEYVLNVQLSQCGASGVRLTETKHTFYSLSTSVKDKSQLQDIL